MRERLPNCRANRTACAATLPEITIEVLNPQAHSQTEAPSLQTSSFSGSCICRFAADIDCCCFDHCCYGGCSFVAAAVTVAVTVAVAVAVAAAAAAAAVAAVGAFCCCGSSGWYRYHSYSCGC